jgi:hypothetical protein
LTLLAAALYVTSVLDELRGQLIEYDGVREAGDASGVRGAAWLWNTPSA